MNTSATHSIARPAPDAAAVIDDLSTRSGREAPRRPRRPQGRRARGLMRVLLADRGHGEARTPEGVADIRIRVEVLPVVLAERLPPLSRGGLVCGGVRSGL